MPAHGYTFVHSGTYPASVILPPSMEGPAAEQPMGPEENSRERPWCAPGGARRPSFALLLPPAAGGGARLEVLRAVGERWVEELAEGEQVAHVLRGLLESGPLILGQREAVDTSSTRAEGIALEELEALCAPVRAGNDAERELPCSVNELRERASRAVGRVRSLAAPQRALLSHAWDEAWQRMHEAAPRAARGLALVLELIESAPSWTSDESEPAPEGGGLEQARALAGSLEEALDQSEPRWASERPEWMSEGALPPTREQALPFAIEDRARLDAIFQRHLPRRFGPDAKPRAGQLEVARQVADSLGSKELLLVQAPTGTGKTLAYLVPLCLWSARHDLRVGVATYTRALQEQAAAREVPLALEACKQAGLEPLPRVAVLKGRRNYLCWRALRLAAPTELDPPAFRLGWISLVLYGFLDPEGDLDRFPPRLRLPGLDARELAHELSAVLRQARAESGCCRMRRDRQNCAAELAQRRAERAHVVITNQSLALLRPELFRHLIFDECEHLHDVAHATWSHRFSLGELEGLLGRLMRGRGRSSGPLERVRSHAPQGSNLERLVEIAAGQHRIACRALDSLRLCGLRFCDWRREATRGRGERDTHSLFREYVCSDAGEGLRKAHSALSGAMGELSAALDALPEELESLPARGLPRLRRNLDVLRSELADYFAGIEAWIPRGEDEAPRFRTFTFYDLEQDRGDELVICARLLLPHEALGRGYYPELAGAVLLSATTWLRGSFRTARSYLGLERAAEPAEDEDREPCVVREFRSPEVFDYGRVVVATPRDAPAVRDKDNFLEYAARFVAHLSERSQGRLLALFTNADDCRRVGERLAPFFAARELPLYYQRMEGTGKEELSQRFRADPRATLLGLDTFWYGADFPGETLQYLVLARLPYGVPDAYHHAQCAALGQSEQYARIYMPRALAKFRQGFGRLMRRESDKGCVFVLDHRLAEARQRVFLRELPLELASGTHADISQGAARFVRGETDHCLRAAWEHMGLEEELVRRGMVRPFSATSLPAPEPPAPERTDTPF